LNQCREYQKLIYDFYDDIISEDDKIRLNNHFKVCEDCLAFSNRVKKMKQILNELPRPGVSENFNILLRERLRRELARQKQPSIKTKFLVPAFATGLLFIVIGWLSINDINLFNSGKNIASTEKLIQEQKKITNGSNVQYVIDQYGVEESSAANNSKIKNLDKNLSDSLKSLKNTDQIRVRLTPVSF